MKMMLKGEKMSEETRRKMSEAAKGENIQKKLGERWAKRKMVKRTCFMESIIQKNLRER